MFRTQPTSSPAPLFAAIALALLCHALLLGALGWSMPWEVAPPQERPEATKDTTDAQPMRVRTLDEESFKKVLAKLRKKTPKPKPPEPPKPMQPAKVVTQQTNAKMPKEAKYLSQQANATPEETRARKTTMAEVIPDKSQDTPKEDASTTKPQPTVNAPQQAKPVELARASKTSASKPAPLRPPELPERTTTQERQKPDPQTKKKMNEADDGPMVYKDFRTSKSEDVVKDPNAPDAPLVRKGRQAERATEGQADPRKVFAPPSTSDMERMYGDADDAKVARQAKPRRQQVFANIARRQKLLKGSLENMISEVKPGNHTSVNAKPAVYAGYMASIHRKIHARWANDFLISIDTQYPRSSPLQNPQLHTTLEFVIEAKTGKFTSVNIVKSSGELMFDAEAIDTSWAVGKRPNPPKQIVSPNGNVYIHWNFWRDGRQCGLFGAQVFLLQKDGSKVRGKAPKKG